MCSRTVVALTLLLALGAGGCARGAQDDPDVATARTGAAVTSSGPSAAASHDPDAPLKFSQCMRAHGITWFPDPDADGHLKVMTPKGTDPGKVEAAQQACAAYAPDGGLTDHQPTAAEMEQLRQLAKCMRAHGVPNFPDPKPAGGIDLDKGKLGTGPGDPTFDKAQKLCDQYLPGSPVASSGQHAESRSGQ
jgi:hypothetical protein